MTFFFSSRSRHTRWPRDWSSDVCSSDLGFQNQITQKIYDFWGHIHISDGYTNKFFETNPIRLDSAVIEEIKYLDLRDQGAVSTVRSVNGIIQYPVIIQHGSTLGGVIT